MVIRKYVDDYIKYFPERWRWSIKNSVEQHELYMSTRARRCKNNYSNCDLLPDFNSIERDVAQFGFCKVEWTDFFGIVWKGKKKKVRSSFLNIVYFWLPGSWLLPAGFL